MLLSLGAAAVVGAAGVLMGGSEVIAKTIGTLVLLAVCTGLLIWVTRGLADPKSRPSAVLAAGLITAEFLLILGLIWDVEKLIGGRNEWLFQFVFILAGTGLPACFALRFIQHPQGKIASIAGLVLCGVVFGFWVLDLEYDVWRWWESANTLYGIGALVVLCLVGVGTDRRHWRWLGVAAAVAAYAAVAWHLAFDTETGNQTAVTALICAAGVIAHANVALRCPLKPGQKWIARGSVAAMAATAVFFDADGVG
jgi:hypothetical protein